MMLRIDSLLVLLAASAAFAGLPGEGRGQPAPAAGSDGPDGGASPGERLEARARKLADKGQEGWAQAAALYVRAANLRGPSDPAATESLILAGNFYYHADRLEASVLAFRAAGEILLRRGLFAAAAGAFRDGAWVADRAGLTAQARELCEWIEVLTRPQSQSRQGQRRFFLGTAKRS